MMLLFLDRKHILRKCVLSVVNIASLRAYHTRQEHTIVDAGITQVFGILVNRAIALAVAAASRWRSAPRDRPVPQKLEC